MHKYNALTTASPIYNEQGEIIGVFNNNRNISGLAMLRNLPILSNPQIRRGRKNFMSTFLKTPAKILGGGF